MQIARREYGRVMQRVLFAQLVYPPMRIRIASAVGQRCFGEQCFALAQKIAQYRVGQSGGLRLAQNRGAAHRMIDDGVGRRTRVLQLVQSHQEQPAQRLVMHRLRKQLGKHRVELDAEAQRAVTQVCNRGALLRSQLRMARPHGGERGVEIAAAGDGRHRSTSKPLGI